MDLHYIFFCTLKISNRNQLLDWDMVHSDLLSNIFVHVCELQQKTGCFIAFAISLLFMFDSCIFEGTLQPGQTIHDEFRY